MSEGADQILVGTNLFNRGKRNELESGTRCTYPKSRESDHSDNA